MPRATIANTAAALLAEHRALAPDELGELIAALGLTRAKQPARAVSRALDFDRRFRRLSDGRWAAPGQLLRGATLTHRLSEQEATANVLALMPDLSLVATLPGGLLLPDGQPLTILWDEDALEASGIDTVAVLQGPPGWLSGSSPGQLLHVRLADALLRVEPGPEPRAESRLAVRRLVEAARRQLEEQKAAGFLLLPPAVGLSALVLDLLADDPGLLEHPLPPIGEAFAAAGLEVHQSFVGLPGTDWEALDELTSPDGADLDEFDVDDELERRMVEAFDLEPEEVDGLAVVLGAYDLSLRSGGIGDAAIHAGLAQILGTPGIARVLAIKAWFDPDLEAFEAFVGAIERAATGRSAAGSRFVLGSCAEARNDIEVAERRYRSALEADPLNPLALVEVARYETDRGDYAEALEHLRAARVPSDESERAWLEGLTRPAVPRVGRNNPCPCGSGRKYKACHLDGPPAVGPVDTAKALFHKLDAWLSQPNMQLIGEDLLRESGSEVPDGEGAADPMLTDIILFDRGGLRQFLDVRGGLLPEAERALGRTWLLSRRSLHEVQAVRRGRSVTLRDLRAGEGTVEILDRSIAEQAQPLDLLCIRLLPDGTGGFVASDGVLVPRLQRRHVLNLLESGDGLDLLRWIAAPVPLPQLRNTENEPLQLTTVSYRVPDPAAAAAALGGKLRPEGDGRFVEMVVRHGQEWIRGSITLDGDHATIDANSTKRATRLERTLLKAAPGARLIRREELGIDEAIDEERAKGPAEEPVDVAAHPDLARAMEDFMRRAEVSWVDEQIPALGGLTPRQAAADPAARPELEALLDDMAWTQRRAGESGGMDPSRIRALLGIPERSH